MLIQKNALFEREAHFEPTTNPKVPYTDWQETNNGTKSLTMKTQNALLLTKWAFKARVKISSGLGIYIIFINRVPLGKHAILQVAIRINFAHFPMKNKCFRALACSQPILFLGGG